MKKLFFLAAVAAFSLATVANAGNGDDKKEKKAEAKKECSAAKSCCSKNAAKACAKADQSKACSDKAAKTETAKASETK